MKHYDLPRPVPPDRVVSCCARSPASSSPISSVHPPAGHRARGGAIPRHAIALHGEEDADLTKLFKGALRHSRSLSELLTFCCIPTLGVTFESLSASRVGRPDRIRVTLRTSLTLRYAKARKSNCRCEPTLVPTVSAGTVSAGAVSAGAVAADTVSADPHPVPVDRRPADNMPADNMATDNRPADSSPAESLLADDASTGAELGHALREHGSCHYTLCDYATAFLDPSLLFDVDGEALSLPPLALDPLNWSVQGPSAITSGFSTPESIASSLRRQSLAAWYSSQADRANAQINESSGISMIPSRAFDDVITRYLRRSGSSASLFFCRPVDLTAALPQAEALPDRGLEPVIVGELSHRCAASGVCVAEQYGTPWYPIAREALLRDVSDALSHDSDP